MSKYKIIIGIVALTALVLLVVFPGRNLARAHVNERTAVEDHPLLCTSCHLSISKNKLISKMMNTEYYSPFNLAVGKNDHRLYVVAQDSDELLVVDLEIQKVIRTIPVGDHPHSVVVDQAGQKAYVSNEWSDNISVIDINTLKVTDTIPTGNGPAGLALDETKNHLYVVNSFGSDMSIIELGSNRELKRLSTGNDPTGISRSGSGKQLLITARRANLGDYDEPLITELSLVDSESERSVKVDVEGAYLMENAAFSPQGDLVLFTLIRPKNQLPSVQVENGWMMTHGIGVMELDKGGRITQFLLDEPNAFYPDPFDIELSLDGKLAFVSSSGVDMVSVISIDSIRQFLKVKDAQKRKQFGNTLGLSRQFVLKRIKTGPNPKGMVLSSDGNQLFVAEHLNDAITIIDVKSLTKTGTIDLDGPLRITVARQGRRLFSNAGHTFQQQYSCYTCHPDNHEDGLVYNMAAKNMGRNLTNTQSLREIGDTAPFKWNGKNQTVYKQDGIRFSTVLTRTEQFSYEDLDAISAYIMRGIRQPPNLVYNPKGVLNESQHRGKELFERSVDNSGNPIPENNRCVTCHPSPLYSDLKLADVGTLSKTDDSIAFDTPHLTNIYASSPYLHDGRAKTLEEIWTIYGTEDRHGYVNDMTKTQLNDLVNYLNSLRSATYDKKQIDTQQGSFALGH